MSRWDRLAKLRGRPEMLALLVGAAVFVAGLITLVASRVGERDVPNDAPQVAAGDVRLGPPPGAEVAPYIAEAKAALEAKAESQPKGVALAVVSFDIYRRPSEVLKLIGGDTAILRAECRVPVAGSVAEELRVEKGSFAVLVADLAASRRVALEEELSELNKLIPSVDDRSYREVYKQDAEAIRKMLNLLTKDPPIVYGVVIKAEHRILVAISKAPGVRLVDVARAEGKAPSSFTAILPEQKQRIDTVV